MIAILLEFRVKPGAEAEFLASWQETTEIIYRNFGSLGSKLHRAEDGAFIAYAQWPDEATYEAAQTWSEEDQAVRAKMHATLLDGYPKRLHQLSLVSDRTRAQAKK
ncbi:MAG: antibiotic biosynthesis monooxygenase [Pseudomonadota bacterium]